MIVSYVLIIRIFHRMSMVLNDFFWFSVMIRNRGSSLRGKGRRKRGVECRYFPEISFIRDIYSSNKILLYTNNIIYIK
jgi:hypothetical protein